MTTSGAPKPIERLARLGEAMGGRDEQPHRPISARMPSSTRGSLSIASTFRPLSGSPAGDGRRRAVVGETCRGGRAERRGDGEDRAFAGPRVQADRMVEHAAEALDDRKAEAKAAGDPGALVEPPELLEHRALPVGRDAEPGVPHLDPNRARPRAGSRPAPCRWSVYFSALETRFCSRRRISRRSVRIASLVGTKRSSSPLARASGANSTSSMRMRSATGTSETSGRVAPASSREMSRRAPRISSTASSEMSTLRARSARSLALPTWRRPSVSELA